MSSTSWQKNTSVTQHLTDNAAAYSFIQTVRLLERSCFYDSQKTPDSKHETSKDMSVARFIPPEAEAIRFHSSQKLEFHSSDIATINAEKRNKNSNKNKQWHVLVNLMGLTGASGILPYHYTEMILQRLKIKDKSLLNFLDLFNHRTISLFYQASVKYRLPIEYERKRLTTKPTQEKDAHTKALLALVGLGTKHLDNRLYTNDESLLFYSGLLSQNVKTSTCLKQILQRHFSIPVQIKEFVGQWQPLIDDVRTRLTSKEHPKGQNASLSRSAILGRKGWYAQGKIRIILGPLNKHQQQHFAPGTPALKALNEIVRLYAGLECNYDFIIRIKRSDIPNKVELSKKSPPIVGWNTWLPKSGKQEEESKTVDIVVSPNRLK